MTRENKKYYRPSEASALLESDDELPDSYEEISYTPAYQNDSRFEPIRFTWLENLSESHPAAHEVQEQSSMDNEPHFTSKTKEDKTILISKGFLTKRDIFFVKSIEEYATGSTVLWFIEFLKYKSTQPAKSSCLVGNIFADFNTDTSIEPLSHYNSSYYYKLIIKL